MVFMKLDIVKIAKEAFKDKDLFIKNLPKDKVKIWYKNRNSNSSPNPFILPKIIELDEQFTESIGMYLGDGKTTKHDMHHLDFVNKDYDILRFMFEFFTKRLLVRLNNMTISIKYKSDNKYKIREKWSKLLNIPKSK